MRVSAKPKLLRRRDDASSEIARAASVAVIGDAPTGQSETPEQADSRAPLGTTDTDDSLLRVLSELSHDLRQPLTSLNMNLQTAVKMLQLPTPHVSGALEALVDCVGTDRIMIELIAQAKRRAATAATNAPLPLNDFARDLLTSASTLDPHWRGRLGERLTSQSPQVISGFVRLRLALLSILRRSLILDEADPAGPEPILIETRSVGDRAELRFIGLPESLPRSASFQSLHMLITTLVGYLHGHANLTLRDNRVSFVISAPVAPISILHLPGGRRGV